MTSDPKHEQDKFLPEEFRHLCEDPHSVTSKIAEMWQVSPEQVLRWRWHMAKQLHDAPGMAKIVDLGESEKSGFMKTESLFQAGVTPYYGALMDPSNSDSDPIRLQSLPRAEEMGDATGQADPLDEQGHSPVPEVVHVYPDRVAFCVAQLCPVYCRYCFRKRRDDQAGLHFNKTIVARGIDYIAKNKAIKDVLITGGDPFLASDEALDGLLKQISAIPHVEVIRFGTRTPVTLPYRVTRKLAATLSRYHPVWLNTHFNCVEEITPEAVQAVANLVDHGIPVGNQAVLLRGVNDSPEKMMALCRGLVKARVRPYYVFHAHMVAGTAHLRVPVSRGLKIMKSLRGNLSGFAIPTYALDTPSGKLPLGHQHILGEDNGDLLLEDLRGEIWREPEAMLEGSAEG